MSTRRDPALHVPRRVSGKRPWRPHYTRDWHASPFVRSLPLHVRCVYFELLDLEWDEDGLDPSWFEAPYAFLSNRLACHWRTFAAAWQMIAHRFEVHEDGKRRSKRGQEESKRAAEISERRANAAKQRWASKANAMPSTITITDTIKDLPAPGGTGQGLLAIQEPPPPPKPKRPPSPEREAAIEVLQRFRARWVEVYRPADGKPPANRESDWGQLGRVVREHGKDAALGFVEAFLADRDPFLVSEAHALRLLPGRIDKYRATHRPTPTPRARPATREPPKYKSLDEIEAEEQAARERLQRQREETTDDE